MPKILDILSEDENLVCMPTNRQDLGDEYDIEPEGSGDIGETPYETPRPETERISVLPEWPTSEPSPFRYFIDGSRRAFRVADIVIQNRYYPIVAGQVGVAIVERVNRKIRPISDLCRFERYIVFPSKLATSDYQNIQQTLDRKSRFNFLVEKYDIKEKPNMADLGVAKLNTLMQLRELEAIRDLSDNGLLADDRMLIIDGNIQFARKEFRVEDFRYVVGVAKSFAPGIMLGKGRKKKDVGAIVKNLRFGERSHVHRVDVKKHRIGSWYLRVHERSHVYDPLHGIVKIEVFARDDDEFENGIDRSRVDNISRVILSERFPAPYGKDSRWHVHLYPVFQAEQYIKSRFTNSRTLKGAF